jgi:hydantoinase/carbamoylase family amidase
MLGSHLDTQPSGGRYDGILGVTAALEVLRTLSENNIQTSHPIGLVNWTNEEGARFPQSMVASGVWAGAIPLQDAWSLKEVSGEGKTMKEELENIGYLGSTPCSWEQNPMKAHFELHIEQGPKLERSGRKIGVVLGVQGYRWFTVVVKGREAHTGATPFEARSDALLAVNCLVLICFSEQEKLIL